MHPNEFETGLLVTDGKNFGRITGTLRCDTLWTFKDFITDKVHSAWCDELTRVELPKTVSREFLEDVVSFTTMHKDAGVASAVHGAEFQTEMLQKYPRLLMVWLFDRIGWFYTLEKEEW